MRSILFFLFLLADEPSFDLKKIESSFPADIGYKTPLSPEVLEMLDQKFTYFAEGAQSFAFSSEDGRFILKLFKQNKFFTPYSSCRQNLKKKVKLFRSFRIAIEHMQEETGLLFLHLVPNSGFSKEIVLVDQHKQEHRIDLNNYEFILQKYAHLVCTTIDHLMSANEEEKAKRVLDTIFDYFKKRISKKITDRDPNILTNLSYCDGKIIQIDPGFFDFKKDRMGDLKKIKEKNKHAFAVWLKEKFPSLHSYYLEQLEKFEATAATSLAEP